MEVQIYLYGTLQEMIQKLNTATWYKMFHTVKPALQSHQMK